MLQFCTLQNIDIAVGDFSHTLIDNFKRICRLIGNLLSLHCHLRCIFNQFGSILGSLCCFACQIAHLICHHCKAFACCSRSCCLYGCIQCQNVRLEGNILNILCNSSDLFCGCVDFIHGCQHFLHFFIADFNSLKHFLCLCVGFTQIFKVIFNLVAYLSHCGSHLLHTGSLLIGSLCQCLGTGRNLLSTICNLIGYTINMIKHIADFLGYFSHCNQYLFKVTYITLWHARLHCKITFGI